MDTQKNTVELKNYLLTHKLLFVLIFFGLILLTISVSILQTPNKNAPVATLTPTPVQVKGENPSENPQPSSNTQLILLSIDPADGSTNISSYTTFTATFSRPLTQDDVNVSISPDTSITQRIDNNTLYIDTPNLTDATQYSLTLSYSSGQRYQTFHFSTAPANSTIYHDTVGQNIDAWTKINRPDVIVYNTLPYSSNDFSVSAESGNGVYVFNVVITNPDSTAGKQVFIDWLKNTVGLTDDEIAKLQIHYQAAGGGE